MQEKIKQLYNSSKRDEEHAEAYHSLVFDIESFAQRLVFRCATAAKVAQSEGKDAYAEIMQKYGADTTIEETSNKQTLNFHKFGEQIPLVGEEYDASEHIADDTLSPDLVQQLVNRHQSV